MEKKQRIVMLDTIRGILILLVVLYHLLYDLNDIYGVYTPFFYTAGMALFRNVFVGMLVFIAGFSCNLSHSNFKRGIKTFLCGMLITVVTYVFMPEERILFGILHFMGAAMLLYALTAQALSRIPAGVGVLLSAALFFGTFRLEYGYLGIGSFGVNLEKMPDNILFLILGFPSKIYSADYYPLMPWFFLFLTGTFCGRNIKNRKIPQILCRNICPPLSFIGRHTLLIYLLHQPVIYGSFMLIFRYF